MKWAEYQRALARRLAKHWKSSKRALASPGRFGRHPVGRWQRECVVAAHAGEKITLEDFTCANWWRR
jgi:hypothetical protein